MAQQSKPKRRGRPPPWIPHLYLKTWPSGLSAWVVLWRWRLDASIVLHPPEHVPWMTRQSEMAHHAHAFAAKLNQRRGLAF